MRILALTILAIGMASAAPPALAQTYDPNYPVCLQIYQSWNDYYFECAYTSLAQCNMSASGRAAQCSETTLCAIFESQTSRAARDEQKNWTLPGL